MFRDESQRVTKKYQVLQSSSSDDSDGTNITPRSSTEDSGLEAPGSSTRPSSSMSVMTGPNWDTPMSLRQASTPTTGGGGSICLSYPQLMHHPLAQLATNFFLAQYVPGSHFDYLPLLCRSVSADSLLSTVVGAVSIASLSHETRNPELMVHARREYSRSLKETDLALRRPDASCRDDILASILLLAHFEALASEDTVNSTTSDTAIVRTKSSSDYSPSETWAHHITGAFTLLQMRIQTPNHLDSPVSAKLCHHLIDTVRGHCIQRYARLPATMRTLDFAEDVYVHEHDPRRRFALLIEDFAELRAAIDEGSLTNPAEVIRRGMAIDHQAIWVTRELHDTPWGYDIITTPAADGVQGVYKNTYHLYPDHRAAQRWNTMRMTRMAVNDIMYRFATGPELTGQRDKFAKIVRQMATDMCQSSSQFLTRPGTLKNWGQTTGTRPPKESTLSVASAYSLIWPLFTSAISPLSSESVRPFVIDRLNWIDQEMRIPQARRAARMLEEGDGTENWMHMMHLF